MPGPVVAMSRADAKAVVLEVVRAVVDAIASDAAGRVVMPAPPPVVRTGADVGEAVITRLDGSGFVAPVGGFGSLLSTLTVFDSSDSAEVPPSLSEATTL